MKAIEISQYRPEAQSKPFAKQESRTSLGSLVTKEGSKLQHFWGNSVQNTIVDKVLSSLIQRHVWYFTKETPGVKRFLEPDPCQAGIR